ncbi:Protein LEAD-SENSITIVE 1 [Cardamine amara subsp. amara]|uniref:Protein LEAD-SENSITIVE 1 n=1 Tax=Cardamine amara subsp. amara TaxID=228776 RepID=A0ABD1BLM7_CARAN
MGLFSHKISRDELKEGDHIYSWRNAYIYSHHGIYIGDEKVIHFTRGGGLEFGTGTILDKIIEISIPNHGGRDNNCLNCGDKSNLKLGGVISSCLDCFLAGGSLCRFEYSASPSIFLAKRGGTCTIAPSDSSDEVISRAKFLFLRNGFGEYDLLDNNCEDFAIYCKTGLFVLSVATKFGSSGQANSVSAAGSVVSLTLKVLGVKKKSSGGQEDSMVSVVNQVISSTVKYVVPGFGGLALAEYGHYCIGRLFYDIGMRKDACKVPVEELVAFGEQ